MPHSYAIKGQATVVYMDSHHITFKDVRPVDGMVILPFHYQSNLRASPECVVIQREPDDGDLIGFVRLCVDRPVARVTLTWQGAK